MQATSAVAMRMLSLLVVFSCVSTLTVGQFAHFPATGGGRQQDRQVDRFRPPQKQENRARPQPRQEARTAPGREEFDVDYNDYNDIPEVRQPINRKRGRTNTRNGSSGGNSVGRDRSRPRTETVERARPSQPRENLGNVARPSQPQERVVVQATRENSRPVAQDQQGGGIRQFTPQFTDFTSQTTPAQQQQQQQATFVFQPHIEQNRSQKFNQQPARPQPRQPAAPKPRQPATQQPRQPTAPQPRQFPTQQQQQQQQGQTVFTNRQQNPQPSFQPQPARQPSFPSQPARQPSFPSQPARQPQQIPEFNPADSLFSNTIVSPQPGEAGDGVYFSYTAVLNS